MVVVLVLSPDTLKESCWSQENQLWYAHDGFGCTPGAIGRSIRCTCLGDGEETRWNRTDFIGVLKEECLPQWAAEALSKLIEDKEKRRRRQSLCLRRLPKRRRLLLQPVQKAYAPANM
jgi:hypothetical protein